MKNINDRTDISIESFNSRINQGEEKKSVSWKTGY